MVGQTAVLNLSKLNIVLHYVYPLAIILYFVLANLLSICTLQSSKAKYQHVRREVLTWLMFGIVCEYLLQCVVLLIRTLAQSNWFASQDELVFLISSTLVWGIQLLSLIDSDSPVWYTFYVNWFVAITVEAMLVVCQNVLHKPVDAFDFISISFQILRLCNLVLLPCFYLALRIQNEANDCGDTERQSLLTRENLPNTTVAGSSEQNANQYGATNENSKKSATKQTDEDEDDWLQGKQKDAERVAKRLKDNGSWWTYLKGFAIFFPYIWPIHSKSLQFRAVLVGLTLLGENFLHVLVPRQVGVVADSLVSGNARSAWVNVAIYAALSFANSGACIGWLQYWLWQPITAYSYDALNTAAHAHVMNLSSDFHENKEPSEIHQAVFQGRSITGLVDTILFQVLPMFVDLILVFAYLYYLFGPYMALNLAATVLFYLYTTAKLVTLAAARRRLYIVYYRKEWNSAYSSLSSWRAASYFNNIPYEENRYASNVRDYLNSVNKYKIAIKVIGAAQGLIMALGLLGACFLAVYQVMNKIRSPGDFVVLLSYWAQLRGPLGFFSNMYKEISECMMDAEKLLELFQTKSSIVEKEDAKPLELQNGSVNFKNVGFEYDERKVTLKDINFDVEGGTTVAIVGETGSGKSTILKLLDRFYDVTGGSIEIDGQDIRNVTLTSLRSRIGVVPQDPTLFNDSIMNNVRYARLDASDDAVYEACKSAAIHEKIMSFPDGYNSKVGNQGIKLSGGEQQRVAIARAILKRPDIILLDEATSAVDTETEQLIQEAFKTLCHGRTTFVVAHRLSTIMRADRIIVMKDGAIIEDGSHDGLLRMRGKYYDLWSRQILSSPNVDGSLSRSSSPKKNVAKLIDDSIPKSNEAEIAGHAKEDTTQKTSIGEHKIVTKFQGSRLKPEAAEFVPRGLCADMQSANECNSMRNSEIQTSRPKADNDQKKQTEEEQKSQLGLVKTANENSDKYAKYTEDLKQSIDDNSEGQSQDEPNMGQESMNSSANIKDKKPLAKRPRFGSRRHESKRESYNCMKDSTDGADDSEESTGVSSGEGQRLLGPIPIFHQKNRPVSTPGDPGPSDLDIRNSSIGVRPRRPRQERARKRWVLEADSAPTVGHSTRQDTDTDSWIPVEPAKSPAGDVNLSVATKPDQVS